VRAHATNLTRNNTKMLLEIKNIHMKVIKITKQLGFFVFFFAQYVTRYKRNILGQNTATFKL